MCSDLRAGKLVALALLALAGCPGGDERTTIDAVIESVAPDCVTTAAPTQVEIRGVMPVKPEVSLSGSEGTLETGYRAWVGAAAGDVELTDVRWVDAATLTATVPASLAPGLYAVEVESPFGERTRVEGLFQVAAGAFCDPDHAGIVASITAAPAVLLPGDRVIVTVTVRNTGEATATGVTTAVSAPPGFTLFTSAPDPLDVPGQQTRSFTWTYTAEAGAGSGTFTATAAGIDSRDGESLSAPAASSGTVAVAYRVGGTVANLPAGGSLVLQLNGANDVTITRNEGFTFAAPVPSGTGYTVTILAQPTGHTCRITGATGTVSTQDVSSVLVNCDPNSMSLSTAVNGSGSVQCNGAQCAATYVFGQTVTLTAVPATGWSFTSWSGDCAAAGAGACALLMDADKSVTASFELNRYLVTYPATVGGNVSGPPSVEHGGSAVFTATPDVGFSVGAWSGCTAPAGAESCTVTGVTGPITVSATFVRNSYVITFPPTPNGTVTGPTSVLHGDPATFTATPAVGYHVGTWIGCTPAAPGATTCTVPSVTGPITVSATFEVNVYSVTIVPTAGGTVTASVTSVPHGGEVTFTAAPADGFQVGTWSGCTAAPGATTCTVPSVTGPLTVSATFGRIIHPVTITQNPDGTVSGPDSVPHGDPATFTATPAAGYHVGTWSGCAAAPGATTCTVPSVTSPLTVSATFEINVYPITITQNPGGTVSGPTEVRHGDTALYTALPDNGYVLDLWVACPQQVIGQTTCRVTNVTGPFTVSATFVSIVF